MDFGVYEIIILVECVIAAILLIVIIALAASVKNRKEVAPEPTNEQVKVQLYDPYGMYAPVSTQELAEIDRQVGQTTDEN